MAYSQLNAIGVLVCATMTLHGACETIVIDTELGVDAMDIPADGLEDVQDAASDASLPDLEVDLPPAGPLVVEVIDGLELARSTVLAEPSMFAADLGYSRQVYATELAAWLVDGGVTTELGAPAGAVVAAAWVAGTLLLATPAGLQVFHEGALVPSPIHEALGGQVVRSMHPDGSGACWMVTATSLWRWEDGFIVEFTPDGLTVADAVATWGAHFEGRRTLWMGAPGQVYTVISTPGGQWEAVLERTDLVPAALSADEGGHLWVTTDSGGLHHRDPDGHWRALDLGSPVDAVHGHPDSGATWLSLADTTMVLHQAGAWLAAAWTETSEPAATSDGGLLVSTATTTDFLVPQGFLALSGVPDVPVRSPVEVGIVVDDPSRVASITGLVDGSLSMPVTAEPPYVLTLDPAGLTQAQHVLSAVVVYNDGADSKSIEASFEVGPPLSWLADIQPIWESRCTPCHHPDTSSHPLHTAELWRNEIDKIVYNVETGIMPLDPEPELDLDQIELIKAWVAASMPD